MCVWFGDVVAKAAQRGPARWQAGEGSEGKPAASWELHHSIWHRELGLRLSALYHDAAQLLRLRGAKLAAKTSGSNNSTLLVGRKIT